jgi:hypothetical protein
MFLNTIIKLSKYLYLGQLNHRGFISLLIMQNVENVKKIVDSVIKSYPSFRMGGGKKVYTLHILIYS